MIHFWILYVGKYVAGARTHYDLTLGNISGTGNLASRLESRDTK